MRRARLLSGLSLLAFVLAGCGGGGTSGIGATNRGFYSLSLELNQRDIESPAVACTNCPQDISIPPDRITGKVRLTYGGSLQSPLRGFLQKARLCILDKCYELPLSGIIAPGAEVPIDISMNAHKFGLPWIAVNPYEDTVLNTSYNTVNLTGTGTQRVETDTYFNTQKTKVLNFVPIGPGSLVMLGQGDFRKSQSVSGYTTAQGGVDVELDRGSLSANSIKQGSVRLQVGNLKCKDDGSGNIVEDSGTPGGTCSGTINYSTGQLSFQINGVNAPSNVSINYVVSGSQMCMDNSAGQLSGDCTGSINYNTGQLSYKFNDDYVNSNIPVAIQYLQLDASGNQLVYTLPPKSPIGAYTYKVYGRLIEVYQGTSKLCDNQGFSLACQVNVQGERVVINFIGGVRQGISLRYSEDEVIDIAPGIDARQYGGLWNGTSTPEIDGSVEVSVRLESGETLTSRAGIRFRVKPR